MPLMHKAIMLACIASLFPLTRMAIAPAQRIWVAYLSSISSITIHRHHE